MEYKQKQMNVKWPTNDKSKGTEGRGKEWTQGLLNTALWLQVLSPQTKNNCKQMLNLCWEVCFSQWYETATLKLLSVSWTNQRSKYTEDNGSQEQWAHPEPRSIINSCRRLREKISSPIIHSKGSTPHYPRNTVWPEHSLLLHQGLVKPLDLSTTQRKVKDKGECGLLRARGESNQQNPDHEEFYGSHDLASSTNKLQEETDRQMNGAG